MREIYLIWILNDDTGDEEMLLACPDMDTAEAYIEKNPLERPEYYFVSPLEYLAK